MAPNQIVCGDACEVLPGLPDGSFQMILADPPYFQVLVKEGWDNQWTSEAAYLSWTEGWLSQCQRLLREDGLLYLFGQLGKREHVWLHLSSLAARLLHFHDMLVWDRVVGYNERRDSFTPCYESILVLRKTATSKPYFNKDAVRVPYDDETVQTYLRDKRYKDREARLTHLRKGKFATNIFRVPSLKGASKEKVGHPSQKPVRLIRDLVAASTRKGDCVLDPFLGSGTLAVAAEELHRKWLGVEISPTFAALADKRLREFRGGFHPSLPVAQSDGAESREDLEVVGRK